MTHEEFIKSLQENDLCYMLDNCKDALLIEKLSTKILSGCHLHNNHPNDYTTILMDISVDSIIGQVGQFSDCNWCCNHNHNNYSTWRTALSSSYVKYLKKSYNLLKTSPEHYFNPLAGKIQFYTSDYNEFYSTGCSTQAIIAKCLFGLYKSMVGDDLMLMSVKVLKPLKND